MQYRNVGKTGLKISEISIGAWLTYGGSEDKESSRLCITKAIDLGINFIDIAEVISSKVFFPMSDSVNDRGLSRKHIMESIDCTLDRLQTDYLDIYFCHRFDRYTPLEETIRTMSDLVDLGVVHYWGTSVWPAVQLERAIWMAKDLGCHPPLVEQPRYNMLDRYIERDIMETCQRNGIGIVCWSPLAGGLLTGKYNEGVPEGSRGATTKWLQKEMTDTNISKIKQLQPIADKLEITIGQLALAWILRREEMSCAIIGATRPEHVESNVKASEVTLDNNILNQVEEILDNKPQIHPVYRPPW